MPAGGLCLMALGGGPAGCRPCDCVSLSTAGSHRSWPSPAHIRAAVRVSRPLLLLCVGGVIGQHACVLGAAAGGAWPLGALHGEVRASCVP